MLRVLGSPVETVEMVLSLLTADNILNFNSNKSV